MKKRIIVSKSLLGDYDDIVVHLLVIDERLDSLKIIVNAYYLDLDKETFYKWFTEENSKNKTPLDEAASKGNREIIKFLWEKIAKTDEKILRLHEKRSSFFHYAAQSNQVFSILFFYEKLQKYFPNEKIIDMPNENFITPLHYACYKNSIKVVDILLDLGADINAQDCNDKTVLSYAIRSGSVRLVKKLLLRGADKYLYDDKLKTAYDFAIELKKTDIANLLKPKNWFLKTCCNSLELSSIKGLRNDFRTAYFFIFYYIFICYSILFLLDHENDSKNQSLEIMGMIAISGGVFSISIAFLLFVYFSVFFKREKNKNKGKRDGLLTDLYRDGDDICVKCYKKVADNSTHCIACDVCIEDWDHHCFWLNICIDVQMKTKFNIFFYSLFIGALCNCIYGIVELVYCAMDKDHHYELILWSSFTAALLYTFGFILIPLCYCLIMKKNTEVNKTTLTEYEANLLNRSRDRSSYDN